MVHQKGSEENMQTIIKTTQLSKKYKNVTALSSTNLTIEKGCIYGLVGKNGAGKTTLLKMLLGQTTPTTGELSLFGQSGSELANARRRIGAIVEHPAFYPYLTGRQNLEYYRIQKGITEKENVERALKNMGLTEFADRKFKTYSLGNKQRLGLALSLLGNPDLLILDEPINGFDPQGIIEIRKLLLELNQKRHITILLSSHILSELENMITRVGFIDTGRLIEEMDMTELRQKCQRYIEVKVDNSEKAVAVLEQKLDVTDYEVLEGHVIHIHGREDFIPKVSKVLNDADIKIYAVTEIGQSLEDYFIDLVGGMPHD